MPQEAFAHIAPRSIRKISEEELIKAWENRETDRKGSLAVFSHAAFSYRKGDMSRILECDPKELRQFLAPKLPPETVADIKPLLPTGHPSSHERQITGDPAALDRYIGWLRYVGWYQEEIARSIGLSRQTVVKDNPSGEVVPPPDREERLPRPQRVKFYPLRMVPGYIFEDGAPPRFYKSHLPKYIQEKLVDLDTKVAEAYVRESQADGRDKQKRREMIRRTELALVTYAREIQKEEHVSLNSMSDLLRPGNRNYIARMARRHGFDVYVAESVRAVSPVARHWEMSRSSSARAFDTLNKRRREQEEKAKVEAQRKKDEEQGRDA
ncbi:hypothetical protein [Corynebacterium sp. AOP12-C2-36]|uniref:hypothetical protein n=1 Tax=Corynebacterium sp. AOP12-C2-36 TaxID=3457723 RepID=UPI004034881D